MVKECWDCHAHIFGSDGEYPRSSARLFDPWEGSFAEYIERYIEFHRKAGITNGVIVHSNVYGEDNRITRDALRHLGPRYRGVALLNGNEDDRVLSDLSEAGFCACRLNLKVPTSFTVETAIRQSALLRRHGWHIEVLANPQEIVMFLPPLIETGLPIVLDHHAFLQPAEFRNSQEWRMIRNSLKHGGLWVKVSAPYRLQHSLLDYSDVEALTLALIDQNSQRIVWGSDWPHINYRGPRPQTCRMFEKLRDLCNGRGVWDLVSFENPRVLYRRC